MFLDKIKQNSKYFLGTLVLPVALAGAITVLSDTRNIETDELDTLDLGLIEGTTLLSQVGDPFRVVRTVKVMATAYSSSVWETQGDPFITASGLRVRDGIVANNMLPFGTLVRLPEIFGDKIFVVADRMHSRKGDYQIDIWFPSRKGALDFGAQLTKMEILTR